MESSIIQLVENQVLYKIGQADMNIYFVLFGSIALNKQIDRNNSLDQHQSSKTIGKVHLGSTLGEEILFDINLQVRREEAVCERDSCLIGITKNKLFLLQKALLDEDNQKDYYAIESALRGNFLLKDGWRKETPRSDFNFN